MKIIVGTKYQLKERLGMGSFGEIYSGINTKTGEEVAFKLERFSAKMPVLAYEATIIKKLGGAKGFPKLYWQGTEGDYNVVILQILGPDLTKLMDFCGSKFTLKTVLLIGMQMISRLESFHDMGFIHRDLKPDNILIGKGKKEHTIYLIDFGHSKRWQCPRTGKHIIKKSNKGMIGTAEFMSLNGCAGGEQSRKDDLIALGYILIWFLQRGKLPWSQEFPHKSEVNLGGSNALTQIKEQNEKIKKYQKDILQAKQQITIGQLCAGLPTCFQQYLQHVEDTRFEARPNYCQLSSIFQEYFIENGFEDDNQFCWVRQIRINEQKERDIEKAIALKKSMGKETNDFGLLMAGMALEAQTRVCGKHADLSQTAQELKQQILVPVYENSEDAKMSYGLSDEEVRLRKKKELQKELQKEQQETLEEMRNSLKLKIRQRNISIASTEEDRVNELNKNDEEEEKQEISLEIVETKPRVNPEQGCSAMAHAVVYKKLFSFLSPEDRKIIMDRKKEVQDEKAMQAAAQKVIDDEVEKLKEEESLDQFQLIRKEIHDEEQRKIEVLEAKLKPRLSTMLAKVGMFALMKRVSIDTLEDIYDQKEAKDFIKDNLQRMKTGDVAGSYDAKPDTKRILAVLRQMGIKTRQKEIEKAKSVEHEVSKPDLANEKALTAGMLQGLVDGEQEVVRL